MQEGQQHPSHDRWTAVGQKVKGAKAGRWWDHTSKQSESTSPEPNLSPIEANAGHVVYPHAKLSLK